MISDAEMAECVPHEGREVAGPLYAVLYRAVLPSVSRAMETLLPRLSRTRMVTPLSRGSQPLERQAAKKSRIPILPVFLPTLSLFSLVPSLVAPSPPLRG